MTTRWIIKALAVALVMTTLPRVVAAGRDAAQSLAPPVLAVGPVWTSEIDLTWTTSDSLATLTFQVEISTDGTIFVLAASVDHDTAAAISDLAPSTAYWFRVRASDASETSPYSNVVQTTTAACGSFAFMDSRSSALRDVADANDWCGAVFDRSLALRARRAASDLPPCVIGDCDLPAERDATPRDPIEVRLLVHVIRESDGSGGASSALVDSMIVQMNRDFAPHAVRVTKLATLTHLDSRFATLSSLQQLADMKAEYAQTPSQNLNFFITKSAAPFDGIGTYPWDPDALTAQGGIWLNRDLVDGVHHSASHELGHCLGLYHTFHGTEEVESCAEACYEPASGVDADLRGDLCSDTRSTPRNFSCSSPGGCDCSGTPWGVTPLHNIMGYGPALCVNEFTPQQERRALCWARAALGSVIVSLAGAEPPTGDGGELALWTAGTSEPSGGARVWFHLPSPGRVTLALFDVRGRRVVTLRDRDESAGRHELRWDGRDAAGERSRPGVYLLRMVVEGGSASGKLILIH